ncbi:MAG TPA: hypothetical protein VGF99_13985 [Myxococcota bacterium]
MPNTITRSDVQTTLRRQEVGVADLKASTDAPAEVLNRMATADANGDGVITGAAEVDKLFDATDHFDSNGDRDSVNVTGASSPALPSVAASGLTAAVATAKPRRGLGGDPAPANITRSDVQTALKGQEVAVGDLRADSTIPANVSSAAAKADANDDGVIRGSGEVDRLFNVADDLDTNGDRDSVTGSHNGRSTDAGALLSGAVANAKASTVPTETALDDSFRQFRSVDVNALRELLPSQAQHLAQAFVDSGERHNVDPLLLASISKHETANWTSSAFRNKNNAMGVSNSSGPIAMSSHAASIERMASLVGSTTSGPYQNANTYRELWGIYAPGPATGQGRQSNDPTNLNANWGPGIISNINRYSTALN